MSVSDLIAPFPADVDRTTFGHWLSGFTDGEGCFLLYSPKPGGSASAMRARFLISLRFDDLAILQTVRSYFGCGILSRKLQSPSHQRWRPQARFYVDKTADLIDKVIPHFEHFPLRAKKVRDFAVWSQGVRLLHEIYPRRVRSRGFGRGTFPRWEPAERERFEALSLALKGAREYTEARSLA